MSPSPDPVGSAPQHGWRFGWLRWRNRVLASEGFQRLAAANPLMRFVAQRRAARLFDLVAGFTYSQALAAFVGSGLLERLGEGPTSLDEAANVAQLSPEAADRLLRAATALELAEAAAPGWWVLGQQGAALANNAGALAMIRHHQLLYADLADPLALLRADRAEPTALSAFWSYDGQGDAVPYSALMATSQRMVAEQVVPAYRWSRHKALLDVGGGHGVFLGAVRAANPALPLGLFDLPSVIAGAPDFPALHPGNFLRDRLPTGYDLITLIRVLHDHDDAPAQHLLGAVCAALPPGGRLLIAEPMAGTGGAEAMGEAYFGLYLWAMRSGRPRRAGEIGAMLDRAGFRRWREIATPLPLIARIIVADT